jgi:hypothetical protein
MPGEHAADPNAIRELEGDVCDQVSFRLDSFEIGFSSGWAIHGTPKSSRVLTNDNDKMNGLRESLRALIDRRVHSVSVDDGRLEVALSDGPHLVIRQLAEDTNRRMSSWWIAFGGDPRLYSGPKPGQRSTLVTQHRPATVKPEIPINPLSVLLGTSCKTVTFIRDYVIVTFMASDDVFHLQCIGETTITLGALRYVFPQSGIADALYSLLDRVVEDAKPAEDRSCRIEFTGDARLVVEPHTEHLEWEVWYLV